MVGMNDPATVTEPRGTGLPGSARFSPRRRRQISQAVQYTLFVAVALTLVLVADWERVQRGFFDGTSAASMFPELITVAMKNTVIFTITGYVFGFALGLVVALMRLSSAVPNRIVALVFIEVFRGLPALLVFILIGFGLPIAFPGFSLPFGIYGTVALALGLVAAAYLAETFRAGIQAVPRGQMEAARSLGMSYSRAMVTIVVPQAIRIVIPPLTNELILLFKDSSLVFALGLTAATTELTKLGRDVSIEFATSTPLLLAGATYLVITVPLGYAVRRLEARQAKERR
nr:amino acid ABC transporter permease [Haloechinothrix aidingensis]